MDSFGRGGHDPVFSYASRRRRRGRVLPRIFMSLVVAVLLGFLGWYYSALHGKGEAEEDQIIVIPNGASGEDISRILNEAGISHPPILYRMEDIRRGDDYRPKAGEYFFLRYSSFSDALRKLHKGDVLQHSFTIAEGASVADIIAAVNADDRLSGEVTFTPAEGALLPETYFFTRGVARDDLIRRMMESREEVFSSMWKSRAIDLPFETLDEAVILASIIEKETALAEERGLVASVFINRLRKGIRLQSDPTVLYGLSRAGKTKEALDRADLKHKSPWNTYIQKGLPPTPICNPGAASFRAAINPADSPYLYFVADGSGGHAFAVTLEEHNKNVAAWRALRKAAGE